MTVLQVRDFPADMYEKITYEAKRRNRTVAQQTIALIEKGLGEEISSKEQRRRLLERITSQDIPDSVKTLDIVKWIRENRSR